MWGGTTPTMLLAWFTATPSHGWCVSLPAAVGLAVAVGVATKLIFCPCMPAGVPPGSLGLPLIGESLNVLFNFPAWLADRSARHGPVFVSHILFHPVVVVAPTPANVAWFVRTERRGQLQRSLPRALRTIFGRRGLLSQVNGPDRDRVRAAVEDHLRGHNVMGMVRPLAAIVRRRVRRWRRLSGTLEGKRGKRGGAGAGDGGKAEVPSSPSSSSPRAIFAFERAAPATDGLAAAPLATPRADGDAPEGDGAGPPSPHSVNGIEPVGSRAPPPRSWAARLCAWRRGAPSAAPSFPFFEEARALMVVLIVHVFFGADTLGSAQRERLCELVSLLHGGVNAVWPLPFFGLTALERAAAARAELSAIVLGLIVKRRREVDAFRDRPVCLLDSMIGWVDAAGHILPSDVQVDYALEQVIVALIALPSVLNATVWAMADPAKWAAIRAQCEAEKVFDDRGAIDVLRLSRTTLLDRAIFESSHREPPGRGSLRFVRQSRLRLGPYELPRGWMVLMLHRNCERDDGRNDGSDDDVGDLLDSGSSRGCPHLNDGPSPGAPPPLGATDGLATMAAASVPRAAGAGGTPPGDATAADDAAAPVPHPSRWGVMGFGDKACPAAETAVLLIKVVCLVLLQDARLEVAPGAYARHGLLPITHFRVRVHKREGGGVVPARRHRPLSTVRFAGNTRFIGRG